MEKNRENEKEGKTDVKIKKKHAATEGLRQPRESMLWFFTPIGLYSHGRQRDGDAIP